MSIVPARQRIVLFALSFFALALLSGLILPLSTIGWKALWIALCFIGLFAAHRLGPIQSLGELGLRGNIAQGWWFGLLASLPMLVGLAIASKLAIHTSLRVVLVSVLFGPFAEEVLFRGYLFSAALSACPVVFARGRRDARFAVRPGSLDKYAG